MKLFNSFQAVVLFALWPYAISWLMRTPSPFAYATGAGWLAIIAYLVGFCGMVAAVRESID